MAESRSKCELLEQSLRVIAQENLELEADKDQSSRFNGKGSNFSETSKASGDEDNLKERSPSSSLDSDENEEFFDTANDDLTEDSLSITQKSLYDSNEDLKSIKTDDNTSLNMAIVKKTEISLDIMEKDEHGWR